MPEYYNKIGKYFEMKCISFGEILVECNDPQQNPLNYLIQRLFIGEINITFLF